MLSACWWTQRERLASCMHGIVDFFLLWELERHPFLSPLCAILDSSPVDWRKINCLFLWILWWWRIDCRSWMFEWLNIDCMSMRMTGYSIFQWTKKSWSLNFMKNHMKDQLVNYTLFCSALEAFVLPLNTMFANCKLETSKNWQISSPKLLPVLQDLSHFY